MVTQDPIPTLKKMLEVLEKILEELKKSNEKRKIF